MGISRSRVGMVLTGARDIGVDEVHRWSEGMSLDPQAERYFALLVAADTPDSLELRRDARAKAAAMRELHFSRDANVALARWMARWFAGPVFELARNPSIPTDPAYLAEFIWPPVDVDELRTALEQVEAGGFLAQIRQEPTRPVVTPPQLDAEMSRFGRLYHHTQLRDASRALDEQNPQDRFYFSDSINVSKEDLPALREALVRFQVEILDRFRTPTQADRIVQVSVFFFRRTRPVNPAEP